MIYLMFGELKHGSTNLSNDVRGASPARFVDLGTYLVEGVMSISEYHLRDKSLNDFKGSKPVQPGLYILRDEQAVLHVVEVWLHPGVDRVLWVNFGSQHKPLSEITDDCRWHLVKMSEPGAWLVG